VRIDTADKHQVDLYKRNGMIFNPIPKVYIARKGIVRPIDGNFHFDLDMTLHHMQRMATSVIELHSEKDILGFFETESKTIYKDDMMVGKGIYSGLDEVTSVWRPKHVD